MATPTTNGRRTQELVLRDIEAEREQLAAAVDHLREGIGEATDVSRLLRGRLPIASAAAFGTGFFLAGGIGATMRLLARRSRER
jgi:hypothetical protein